MCARYDSVLDAARLKQFFAVRNLRDVMDLKPEIFPGYSAPFIRTEPAGEGHGAFEAVIGVFGLLPHWAKDTKLTKSTYNARSETVAAKPAFRDAWRRAQHCIVPVEAIWEPDWRSGRCQWTRIAHRGDKPMGLAGLWSAWRGADGGLVNSFTLLTLNADAHARLPSVGRREADDRALARRPVRRLAQRGGRVQHGFPSAVPG
jgi:putative SOS response-associated peptidase YedK